jgi:hypothetical protein
MYSFYSDSFAVRGKADIQPDSVSSSSKQKRERREKGGELDLPDLFGTHLERTHSDSVLLALREDGDRSFGREGEVGWGKRASWGGQTWTHHVGSLQFTGRTY